MARKRPAKKSVGVKSVKAAAKLRAAKKAARSASKSPTVAKKTKAKAAKKAIAPPAKTARATKARRTMAKKAAKKVAKRASGSKPSDKQLAKPAAKSARKTSPRKATEANPPLPTARRAMPRISAGRRADSRKASGREALAKNTLAVRAAPARKPARKGPARKAPAKKRPAKRAPAPKATGKTARSRLTPRATQTLTPPILRDAARRRVVKPTAPRPEKPATRVRRAPFRLHALGVREEHPTDRPQITALLSAAFARPNEAAILEGAHAKGRVVVSLVAEYDSEIIGYVSFVRVAVLIDGKTVEAVELAPLAVEPSRQGRGIGSVLVGAGLEAARTAGFDAVVVAGELNFFARFGFSSQIATVFESAGSTPLAALELTSGVLKGASGTFGGRDL